jgi:tetratricopeptide (TPR) repeat protein
MPATSCPALGAPGGGPDTVKTTRFRSILAAALLVAMALAAYWPATGCGYIWDDDAYVVENEALRSAGGLWDIWTDVWETPQYYPLVHSTYWLEYHLWGLNPAGYHVVNILLHALGAVLLWRVLALLRLPGAWVAAAVFALHPVHVESVVWITERKNVLSGVFYLAAALAYLHYALRPGADEGRGRSWWLYATGLVLFVCALLSKTVTCSLPAAMLLVLWWKRGRVAWRDVGALVPFFVLGIAFGLWTAWLERYRVGAVGPEFDLTLIERCLIAGRALWFYAAKIVWPASLAFIYPRWVIDAGIWWQYLFPAGAAAAVGALWLTRKRLGRGPLAAVLFFAGTLLPALGFFNVYPHIYSFVADHFQYLASVGIIALVVSLGFGAAGRLGRRGSQAAAVAAAVVLAALGAVSWRQARVYTDLETLWRDTLHKNPGAWIAHNNLGNVLQVDGRTDEAIDHYREALRFAPQYAEGYLNLCSALQRQGRFDEAINYGREALRVDPDDPEAHNNLGGALLSRGDVDEAIVHLRRAIELRPGFASAHGNLGLCLRSQGDLDRALDHFHRAVELQPDDAMLQANLGVGLYDLGAHRPAIQHLRRAVELRPGNADMHYTLGLAWQAAGDLETAVSHYRRCLELNPDRPGARASLGASLAGLGRYDESMACYRAILRERSDDAEAHHALGSALIATGQLGEGLTHLQEAVRLRPDWPVALNDTAWILATFGAYLQPDEAVRLAERANELTENPDANMLDTLAAAYAAAGRFEQAVAAAQAALDRAAAGDDPLLEQEIAVRLESYRRGEPYVVGSAP